MASGEPTIVRIYAVYEPARAANVGEAVPNQTALKVILIDGTERTLCYLKLKKEGDTPEDAKAREITLEQVKGKTIREARQLAQDLGHDLPNFTE